MLSKFKLLSLLILSSCALFKTDQYSLKDNLYWGHIVEDAQNSKTPFMEITKKESPIIYHQIMIDSEDHQLLTFWGKSLNFDSGAKKQIIDDKIISELHTQFGLNEKIENYVVHAGIAHTYGYLFSNLQTPYGHKRKRWIEPTLNFAFNLQGSSLSPETMEGALLSNVTYFIGTLAFSQDQDRKNLKDLTNASSEIRSFNYYSLSVEHLEEELPGFTLRTSLIHFPFKREHEENEYLLIYSVLNQSLKREVLITAFPITHDAYKKIVDPKNLGTKQPISIRYNAYLAGLMDQKLSGNRKIWVETR